MSHVLPQIDERGEDGEHGVVGHLFLERVSSMGRDAALESMPEAERGWLAELDLNGLDFGPEWLVEQQVEWLGLTGRADVVHRTKATIRDWKFSATGDYRPGDPQPLFYTGAVAAKRNLNEGEAWISCFRPDGSRFDQVERFDCFDLDGFADRVRRIIQRIAEAEAELSAGRVPRVNRGPWCRWCRAFAACPGTKEIMRLGVPELAAELTPQDAGLAWERIRVMEAALEACKRVVKDMATRGPIPLPGGRVLRVQEHSRRVLSGAIARAVLLDRFGPEVADSASAWTVKIDGVKRALKGRAPKGGGAALEREVMDAIAKAGGMSVSTWTQVDEVDP